MTRVVIISDLHSLHRTGLVHPDFDSRPHVDSSTLKYRLYRLRRTMYKSYEEWINELKPVDVLIVNGDAIEGKGPKSGGTELLSTDRSEQASNAAALINMWGAKFVKMTYGTPYHTGASEDWEDEVAKEVTNLDKIESTGYYQIDDVTIQARHFVGRSSVPYGRLTPLAKQNIWNLLWQARGEYPKVDIIIRSHVHYFTFCGEADWTAFTTPALQGYWTKYGTRVCTGTVDFGLMYIDVEGRDYTWKVKLQKLRRRGEEVWNFNKMTTLGST